MNREHVVGFIRIALSASLQRCHAGEDVAPASAPKLDYYPVRVDDGKRWTAEPMGLERCETFAKRQAGELVCEAQVHLENDFPIGFRCRMGASPAAPVETSSPCMGSPWDSKLYPVT